jgi:hypothetical protein
MSDSEKLSRLIEKHFPLFTDNGCKTQTSADGKIKLWQT